MTTFSDANLPVAVIGAGPVGLAAAAQLLERGIEPLVLEQGSGPAAAIRQWGHVTLFSPWRYNIDAAAERLLMATGWTPPPPDRLPTGAELVEQYLEPLARLPELASQIRYSAEVAAVSRLGLDRMNSAGRDTAPFALHWRDSAGTQQRSLARAVIDASGTWRRPSPMGTDGLPVPGEDSLGDRIAYGIPNVLGQDISVYAGHHVLVVGGGHSAINVVLDLLRLQERAPGTRVTWALRRDGMERLLGGGLNDALPARGALGLAARDAVASGRLQLLSGFAASGLRDCAGGIAVTANAAGSPVELQVDRIVVATGFRPDRALLAEMRVEADPITEAPPLLAPLIDPNLHSCGTVPPHGARELRQPEPDLYIVGAKSYGRAPTFLMRTGYEQVRSVVAELAGDHAAAERVELVLPETGVCGAPSAVEAGCCGGPAPAAANACCLADAEIKAAGGSGCGCRA